MAKSTKKTKELDGLSRKARKEAYRNENSKELESIDQRERDLLKFERVYYNALLTTEEKEAFLEFVQSDQYIKYTESRKIRKIKEMLKALKESSNN